MARITCESVCKTDAPVTLAAMPCFHCGTGVLPEGIFSNTPPSARSLTGAGMLLTGTNISPRYAQLARNADLEMFIVPMNAAVAVLGPSTDGIYSVTLGAGQELSFAFGVTSLNGERITAGYDVTIEIQGGGGTANATLIDNPANPSTYGWQITGAGEITDSSGDASTVQNAERIAYLVAGGLLPPLALQSGEIQFAMTATPKDGGEAWIVQAIVNQTVAP